MTPSTGLVSIVINNNGNNNNITVSGRTIAGQLSTNNRCTNLYKKTLKCLGGFVTHFSRNHPFAARALSSAVGTVIGGTVVYLSYYRNSHRC
jgi:hypothetical protein